MVMPTQPQRPTLTQEERTSLMNAEGHLRMAQSVYDDLQEIGADVTADVDFLHRTETMRAGLLDRFSTGQLKPATRSRARR